MNSFAEVSQAGHAPGKCRSSKDHINIQVLQMTISAIPLLSGLGTRMCGRLGPYYWRVEPLFGALAGSGSCRFGAGLGLAEARPEISESPSRADVTQSIDLLWAIWSLSATCRPRTEAHIGLYQERHKMIWTGVRCTVQLPRGSTRDFRQAPSLRSSEDLVGNRTSSRGPSGC